MPDILIRGLSADDVAALDEQARRVGLTRSEYLRRRLREQARRSSSSVTAADLRDLATIVADLGDAEVMRDAWS